MNNNGENHIDLPAESHSKKQASSDVIAEIKSVPKKEFIIFGIAACGQGMIYAVMSSFVADFYINVLQTPLIFVLLLMLLARVWDAINDPLMGMIVDRVSPKRGKMKPYILYAALPIGVLSFIMFCDPQMFFPSISKGGVMAFVAIVYVLWGMIYTVADVPFWSIPNVMTPQPGERASVISFGRTLNAIGSALPTALFFVLGFVLPSMLSGLAETELEKRRYFTISLICSIIGIALYILAYFRVNERVKLPDKKKRDSSQPGTLMRILKCKPLMIVVIMGILASGRYLVQGAAIHVARYAFYIGRDLSDLTQEEMTAAVAGSVSAVSVIFQIASAIGMFGSMLLMPALYKRFNYKQIIIVTSFCGFIASLFTLMMGLLNIVKGFNWATYACIPFIIIQCVPLGALNITSYAMIGDSLDYMEWKTGFRDTALSSACQGFVNKLANALATCMIVISYIIIELDPAQIYSEKAVIAALDLSEMQRIAMFSLVSIIPGISVLLSMIPVFWYDIVGKKKAQITRELASRRESSLSNA
ncbi:MAG: MFS transporter [Christensenellaceae bacterium]|jgi:Na+/melibiose symporter-like transporter|nr:MFS transporter [Christensenellaceae bacterium]